MMAGLLALVASFGFGHAPATVHHAPEHRPAHCRVLSTTYGAALGSVIQTTTSRCGKRIVVTETVVSSGDGN